MKCIWRFQKKRIYIRGCRKTQDLPATIQGGSAAAIRWVHAIRFVAGQA